MADETNKKLNEAADELADSLYKQSKKLNNINFNILRESKDALSNALKLYAKQVENETKAVMAADLVHRQVRLQGDRLRRSYGQFADSIYATVKIQNNNVAQARTQFNLAQAATAQAIALLKANRDALTEQNKKVAKLKQESDEIKNSIKQKQQERAALGDSIAAAKEALGAQKEKVVGIRKELTFIKDLVKEQQEQRNGMRDAIAANKEAVNAKKEEVGYVNSQLNVATQERTASEQRIQKIKEINALLDSEIQSTKDKLKADKSTVESLKAQIDIKTSIRAESGRNIDKLKYLNDSYTSEISELNKALTQTQAKYKRGQKMSAADESLIAELEAMKTSAENRRATNQEIIDREIANSQSLSASINEMEAQILQITGQEAELQSKLVELEDALGQNKDELVKQNIKHLGLTESVGRLQSEADKLTDEFTTLQNEQKALGAEYQKYTDSINGLITQGTQLDAELKNAIGIQSDLQKTQDGLNEQYKDYTDSISELYKKGVALSPVLTEALNEQKKLTAENGDLAKSVNDLSKEMETKRQELINAKFERFSKVTTAIAEKASGFANALQKLVGPILELQKQFGISAGSAAKLKFENLMASANSYIESLKTGAPGVSAKEIEDTQSAFQGEFGGVLTSTAATDLAKEAKRLGVGAGEMAKARRVFMTSTMGDVGQAKAAQDKFIGEFAKKGLTAKDAMAAIGQNSELLARNGTRFASSFARAAADAKKIGVDLSKIDQVGDNIIDNFEGFLESQAELGAMGFNFDGSKLAELAESGDTGALMNELRSQLASTGKDITKLRRSEQLALSKSFGLSMEELQRMAGPTAGSGEATLSPEELQKGANDFLEKLVFRADTTVAILTAIAAGIALLNMKGGLSLVRSGGRLVERVMGRGGAAAASTAAEAASAAGTAGKAASVVGEAATAGRVAGTAVEAAGAVGTASRFGSLAKFGGKALGVGGRLLGKAALPLSIAMSAYDAYKGFTADKDATTGEKFKNAGSSVLSGLTFGLLGKDASEIAAEKQAATTATAGQISAPSTAGVQTAAVAASVPAAQQTPAPASAPTVNVDFTRLEQKLDAVVRAIGSMEVKMDGNKVGKILVNTSDSARTVGVFRQDARATL